MILYREINTENPDLYTDHKNVNVNRILTYELVFELLIFSDSIFISIIVTTQYFHFVERRDERLKDRDYSSDCFDRYFQYEIEITFSCNPK